jgi:DNA invertase Pin-like site-specific DNA recombinase
MSEIIGYARVSTHSQDLEVQKRRLKEVGAIRILEDIVSGKNFDRPGLSAALDYARPDDLLCVVRLDRLGRSLQELLEIVEQLKRKGIGLMSLEEKIDTSSAAGELVFHVFGAIAHFERRLISERTRDGIKTAIAKGNYPGRPRLDPDKLESAFKLIESRLSPTKAAKQLGIGRSTLYKHIKKLRPDLL